MSELAAVRQGLVMAWQLGFKIIQLELDSNVVLTWLTNTTVSYPTKMMSLICDCRSLIDRDWVVQVQHIYHEQMHVWTCWQSRELTNRTF